MMAAWIKFHEELTKGSKRSMTRATRFVFMELSLRSRPKRGVLDVRHDVTVVDAIHEELGGGSRERKEVAEAWLKLSSAPQGEPPMVLVEEGDGWRRLVIPSWATWNSVDGSAERVKKHRENRQVAADVTRYTPVTALQAAAVTAADVTPLDKSRSEERREEGDAGEPRPKSPPLVEPRNRDRARAIAEELGSRPDLFGAVDFDAIAARLAVTLEGEPAADAIDRRQIGRELVADAEAYAAKFKSSDTQQRVAQLTKKLAWILREVGLGKWRAQPAPKSFAQAGQMSADDESWADHGVSRG